MAYHSGLLSMNYVWFWGIAACHFELLGFQVRIASGTRYGTIKLHRGCSEHGSGWSGPTLFKLDLGLAVVVEGFRDALEGCQGITVLHRCCKEDCTPKFSSFTWARALSILALFGSLAPSAHVP